MIFKVELTKCTEKLLRKSPNYANYEENPYLTFFKPIFLLIRGTQFCRVINLKIRLYYFPKTIFLFFFLSHYNMHVKSWYHQISVDIGVRYTHWISQLGALFFFELSSSSLFQTSTAKEEIIF